MSGHWDGSSRFGIGSRLEDKPSESELSCILCQVLITMYKMSVLCIWKCVLFCAVAGRDAGQWVSPGNRVQHTQGAH